MYKNELLSFQQKNKKNLAKSKKRRYSKEKAAEYYLENKGAIKKSKNRHKNLPKEEKDKIKEYQIKRYQQLIQHKKEALQNK